VEKPMVFKIKICFLFVFFWFYDFYGFMVFQVFIYKVKNSLKTQLHEVHCMILLK